MMYRVQVSAVMTSAGMVCACVHAHVCVCVCTSVCTCTCMRLCGRGVGKGLPPRTGAHLGAHAVDFVQQRDDQAVEVPQVQHKDPERQDRLERQDRAWEPVARLPSVRRDSHGPAKPAAATLGFFQNHGWGSISKIQNSRTHPARVRLDGVWGPLSNPPR